MSKSTGTEGTFDCRAGAPLGRFGRPLLVENIRGAEGRTGGMVRPDLLIAGGMDGADCGTPGMTGGADGGNPGGAIAGAAIGGAMGGVIAGAATGGAMGGAIAGAAIGGAMGGAYGVPPIIWGGMGGVPDLGTGGWGAPLLYMGGSIEFILPPIGSSDNRKMLGLTHLN